jgi:pimeloyl-ACP methyl ester carboxylesterase
MGDAMRFSLILVGSFAGIAVLVAAGILAFDAPVPPKPMQSVETALDHADFSDMPAPRGFTARDGTKLTYRAYPGNPANTVILIHGSSGNSASMHLLARALHERGANVYALSLRGHDHLGRSGDIDYVGQLDDDLADFVKTLPPEPKGGHRTLLGFSSGGGFALRIAGGPYGHLFNRFILLAPALPHDAPTIRPPQAGVAGGGWVSVAIPRIVILTTLSRLGIHAFEGLPVLAFAVPPRMRNIQTAFYSFRMAQNFGATRDYLGDLKRAPGPVSLFDGANDEIFIAGRFAPLLKPARPDLTVTILPGLDHMDMIVAPAALKAIGDRINGAADHTAPGRPVQD